MVQPGRRAVVKLGVIARAEDRGIGIQVWELCRAMCPDRVLVVDMGEFARGFPMHLDRFPGATVVPFARGGILPEGPVREWLRGLDVVFAVETLYDWRVAQWAEEAGAATVCQVNPELLHPDIAPNVPQVRWWAPTPWRLHHLPEGTRVVPVPVAGDRFTFSAPEPEDELRVLHVAGHRASGDRNGTNIVIESLPRLRPPMRVRITTQDPRLPVARRRCGGVPVEVDAGGVADYWRLYDDADVLVMPRRYGGLCLPVQEAMAAGLAVVMSEAEPQVSIWPVDTVLTSRSRPRFRTQGGILPLHAAKAEQLAQRLNQYAADRSLVAALQQASLEWARANTWEALRPLYEREFDLARR